MLAALMIGSQRSALWRISARISSGEDPIGSACKARIRSAASACFRPLLMASEIFCVISFGVPGGATIAIQVSEYASGKVCAKVATCREFRQTLTAAGRDKLQPAAFDMRFVASRLSARISTWPASRSVIAGALPRYGTCNHLDVGKMLDHRDGQMTDLPLALRRIVDPSRIRRAHRR